MSSMTSMDVLRQRHAEAKQADDARNALVEDLLQKVDDLQKTMDRNAFVMVLIDGDCMNFLNHLVKQGMTGGDEAAKLLRRSVFDYLRNDEGFTYDHKIVIRVYANIRGLSKTYSDMGILPNTTSFADFVLGFNKAHPLCDFIDAGNHKEAADTKLKEILSLYVYNVHCKQIVFGASSDNGYASFLSSFFIDTDVSSRIRILKGPPFSFEFRNIISKFRWTEFKTVFRSDFICKEIPRRGSQEIEQKRGAETLMSTTNNTSSLPRRPQDTSRHNTTTATSNVPFTKDVIDLSVNKPSASREDAIKSALVNSTNQRLKESPRALDFGIVKQRAQTNLGLPSEFWGKNEKDEWFMKSKNIIKKAVEDWVQETGNLPPKNATWMTANLFPVPIHRSSITSNASSASSQDEQAAAINTQSDSGSASAKSTPIVADEWSSDDAIDDFIHSLTHGNHKRNVTNEEGLDGPSDKADQSSSHVAGHAKAASDEAALDDYDGPKQSLVYQNSKGQRIDVPTKISYDKEALYKLRGSSKKLCNRFYLGRCPYGERCQFDHEPVFSRLELHTLRYFARCNPCFLGSSCQLGDCTNGHMCPYSDNCDMAGCRFKDMHKIDTEVANVIEGATWT